MPDSILVVDDRPELRLLIRLSLLTLGRVDTAATTAEVLERVHTDPPRLLVLDVSLGTECGLSLCKLLKADPATSMIRIILLSAHGQRADVAAGMAAGADSYVIKPFSPRELLAAATALMQEN
ncbi:response regulator transcription factor [Massilia jejuensis]|uniref:Response regulator transcription factor n=1 Tax=Massilia jejuensis TaxID=648894 RepID=A0ABW0PBQ8_9BURK